MKIRANLRGEKDNLRTYMSHINWDWLFLKGQLILVSILLIVFFLYMLWFF